MGTVHRLHDEPFWRELERDADLARQRRRHEALQERRRARRSRLRRALAVPTLAVVSAWLWLITRPDPSDGAVLVLFFVTVGILAGWEELAPWRDREHG
jgi:fatty acid desaturase